MRKEDLKLIKDNKELWEEALSKVPYGELESAQEIFIKLDLLLEGHYKDVSSFFETFQEHFELYCGKNPNFDPKMPFQISIEAHTSSDTYREHYEDMLKITFYGKDPQLSQQFREEKALQELRKLVMERKPLIKISDLAREKINLFCGDTKYLKISLAGGGCAGFSYQFDLVDSVSDKDQVVADKVLFEKKSALYLVGMSLTYKESLLKTGFEVEENPNAESSCGCGTSFSVKR